MVTQKLRSTRVVTVLQEGVAPYRVAFFNGLQRALSRDNIELIVRAGRFRKGSSLRDDLDSLGCGEYLQTRYCGPVYWHSRVGQIVKASDLIVIPQENRFLNTYPLVLRRRRGSKVAFWGHGQTLKRPVIPMFSRLLKARMATRADWWFAYTEKSRMIVEAYGYPKERITVVDNAIDTTSLRNRVNSLTESEIEEVRRSLFEADTPSASDRGLVGVFCGRLEPLKNIPFLLECASLIHDSIQTFRMVIVGDGPDRKRVLDFCADNPWCVWAGAIHGLDRVPILALGDVWMNPSALGLAVLDAFAIGIPVATTSDIGHGPELYYLESGVNGVITAPNPTDFANGTLHLLLQPRELAAMKAAAAEAGRRYTIERMISLFSDGVNACLDAAPTHAG